jgi:hypothetical protein
LFDVSSLDIFQVSLWNVFSLHWWSLVDVALNAPSWPGSGNIWVIENRALICIEVILYSSTSKLVTFPTASLPCRFTFIVEWYCFKFLLRYSYRSSVWDGALTVLHLIIASRIIMLNVHDWSTLLKLI